MLLDHLNKVNFFKILIRKSTILKTALKHGIVILHVGDTCCQGLSMYADFMIA